GPIPRMPGAPENRARPRRGALRRFSGPPAGGPRSVEEDELVALRDHAEQGPGPDVDAAHGVGDQGVILFRLVLVLVDAGVELPGRGAPPGAFEPRQEDVAAAEADDRVLAVVGLARGGELRGDLAVVADVAVVDLALRLPRDRPAAVQEADAAGGLRVVRR